VAFAVVKIDFQIDNPTVFNMVNAPKAIIKYNNSQFQFFRAYFCTLLTARDAGSTAC